MGQSWFCHLCSGNGLLHLNHSTMGAEKAMRGNAWFKLKKSKRFTSLIDQKSPFDARKKDLKAQQRYTGFNRIKFDEVIFSDPQVIHSSTDSIALRLHRSTQIHSSTESTAQQLHDAFSHATCPLFGFFVSFFTSMVESLLSSTAEREWSEAGGELVELNRRNESPKTTWAQIMRIEIFKHN